MRRALRAADWGLVLAIVAATVLAFLIDAVTDQRLRPIPLVVVGSLFAVVPAWLWLVLFYRQDRVEPEPKHMVGSVLVVTALAAAAVSEPLVRAAPLPDGPVRLLVLVFVVGILREFTKYLGVRLIPVLTGDMNERADGVIYGTAAGLGYAVALNVAFVIEAGGAALAPGFAWMTAITLVHAALGGLVGYLVARDHLESTPVWWLPLGLVAAAVVDAGFLEARFALVSSVSGAGGDGILAPLVGVGLALLSAALITVSLIAVMSREEARG